MPKQSEIVLGESACVDTTQGKVVTACGPVWPQALGSVLMHEHFHCDFFDWQKEELVAEEKPISDERREYLMKEAVPYMQSCGRYGCFGFLEATPPPFRAWPTFYAEVSGLSGMHIILCTGCYRQIETGTFRVKKAVDAIWPFAVDASVEELEDYFTREILEGIHGTQVRAGAIKLAASAPRLTETETKAFRGGARAQKATGVHITTHCTRIGGETSQLRLLEEEGVDLSRVVIGHTAVHLMNPECRKVCLHWMRRGANFMPSNMGIRDDPRRWQPLVDAIHEVFDAGLGDRLCTGLDWAFTSESGPFGPCDYIPPPPFEHMFTHTLPAFREMGLAAEEEKAMLYHNPWRILPVRK